MSSTSSIQMGAALLAVTVAAALTGCHAQTGTNGKTVHLSKAPKAISRLDCPLTQGGLTRQTAAPDGRDCTYTDGKGQRVQLQLVSLGTQTPQAMFDALDRSLAPDMPAESQGEPALAPPPPPEPPPPVLGPASSIEAPDRSGDVDIKLPGMQIHAGGNRADIRMKSAVTGIRRSFMTTSTQPGKTGYRTLIYEARGPDSGPVVIGIFKGKSDNSHAAVSDFKTLLHRNSGR